MMKALRSLLPFLLVCVMTVLTACGSGVAEAPPTYTPEKIAEIQRILSPVEESRERMPELKDYIEEEDWTNVDSFIHGPLGGLRGSLGYLNRILLEDDQPPAKETSEKLFKDLERIDDAAEVGVYDLAVQSYQRAVKDFDAYLDIIPTESDSESAG